MEDWGMGRVKGGRGWGQGESNPDVLLRLFVLL